MSVVSLVIGSLQSPALYVSGFVAEVYTDSARTHKVASMASGAYQQYALYGSTAITQATVTPGTTPQSVAITSFNIAGHTIGVGSNLLVGAGAAQEVVTVISTSTVSSVNYIYAVFLKAHVLTDAVSLMISIEPLGVWTQSSLMVANGLTPSTTYYIAAGPKSASGLVNWTFSTLTTAAAGVSFTGTYSAASTGVVTYALTPVNPPGDLLYYQAQWIPTETLPQSGYNWTGSTTASPAFSTAAMAIGAVMTLFVRAVGVSGNYPWIVVDQRTIAASSSSGSINTSLGLTLDSLVPFVSGMTPSFPPPLTLINPSFEEGNVGWTLGTNWAIGLGNPCFGTWSAYVAGTVGSPLTSSSSITNTYQMAVTVGSSYFAQAMIDGSAATGGYGAVFIAFYNASNVLLSTTYGNQVASGGAGWNQSQVTQVAPSTASYALVGCTVTSQTSGTVYVDDFEANALPPGPVGVPSGPVYIKLANVDPDHSIHVSTALNPQGSLLPNQIIPLTYSTSTSGITVTCTGVSLLRADGTTFLVVGGTMAYTSLSASTTYYIYPFIRVSDGTLQFSNPTPPGTSASNTQAMQASLDGCIPLGSLVITTPSTGTTTGTGGGSGGCPEADELVDVLGKGKIRAGDVVAGDFIRGRSFTNNQDIFRRVIQTRYVLCASWRLVNGYRCSPTEPVYYDGAWTLAYRVPNAPLDKFRGYKAIISVETDDYDEQNYYLVSKDTELLIHNYFVLPC